MTGLRRRLRALVNLDGENQRFRDEVVDHLRNIDALTPGERPRLGGGVSREAVEQLVREAAFTHLNRLCAFELMEHPDRRLIRETVGRGLNSNGFKFYLDEHPNQRSPPYRRRRPGLWRAR
jgi:hypothetical protein